MIMFKVPLKPKPFYDPLIFEVFDVGMYTIWEKVETILWK